MLRTLLTLSLVIGIGASGPSFAADETYTLKLYRGSKGDRTEHETSEDSTTEIVVHAAGQKEEQASSKQIKEAYTEEILEKKDGVRRPTKLTRAYTVAEKTEKGETAKAVYAGRTVSIEKKGDRYEFRIDGKALKEDEAPELFKTFNRKGGEPPNEDFMPRKPVKVGECWTVPADQSDRLFESLGEENVKLDAKKSTIEGKLLKAYRKGGAQLGVIEVTITAVVTEIDLGGEFAKTKADSKIIVKGTMDTCIDGSVPFEDSRFDATVDITAAMPGGGSIRVKGTTKGVEKVRASKP